MHGHRLFVTLTACLVSQLLLAQSAESCHVPRNSYGQPDFEGVWTTVTHTMLERPPGLPLVPGSEQAAGFAQARGVFLYSG